MALSSAYINRFNAPFAGSEAAARKSVLCHVHLKFHRCEEATFGALAWLWMKEIILLERLNIIPRPDLRKLDSLLCLRICKGGSRDFGRNYPHLFSFF